jgi:hypothetical protein
LIFYSHYGKSLNVVFLVIAVVLIIINDANRDITFLHLCLVCYNGLGNSFLIRRNLMEVVRKIIDSDAIDRIIALPVSFKHKKVEVLVLPVGDVQSGSKAKGSAYGALKSYGNPSLIEQESSAWTASIGEKYANR